MGFGINKLIKELQPQIIFQKFKRQRILCKHKGKDLILGLGCGIHSVVFGKHVYIGYKVNLINVEIRDYSYINSNTIIKDSKIGKFCSIASGVKIVLGSHPTNLVSLHPTFYSNNKGFKTFSDKEYYQSYNPVEIGNDVWIGENVMIPGGIKIGNGAIIAAGAIVTKDVLPYEVVGGVPAKHIKFRFSKKQIELLEAYRWWDKDENWLRKNFKLFHNPEKFMNMVNDTSK